MPQHETAGMTPNKVAKRYGVGVHKVLSWIDAGELVAVNVAQTTSRRPRWVILPEALADFERRRAAQPKVPTRRRSKQPKQEGVTEYY